MAESVKRRVAAARLAVAFVAAGTIAGASAWASASPPPPVAQTSAKGEHIKKATLTVRHSDQVVNGSLLFEDFKKGEVASGKHFAKVEIQFKKHKATVNKSLSTIKGEIGDIKSQIDGIKGELSTIKGESSSYLKVTDDVVRGDGSVFSADITVGAEAVDVFNAPSMFTVDATGPVITITNTSSSPLSHTDVHERRAGRAGAGGLDRPRRELLLRHVRRGGPHSPALGHRRRRRSPRVDAELQPDPRGPGAQPAHARPDPDRTVRAVREACAS